MWLDSCGEGLQNFRRKETCGRLSCHAHSKMFDGRPAAEALLLFIVEQCLSPVLPAHESPRLGNGLTFILPCDRFKWSSILRLTSGIHAQRGQLPREKKKNPRCLLQHRWVYICFSCHAQAHFHVTQRRKDLHATSSGLLVISNAPSPACANVFCLICVCVRVCTHSRMQA